MPDRDQPVPQGTKHYVFEQTLAAVGKSNPIDVSTYPDATVQAIAAGASACTLDWEVSNIVDGAWVPLAAANNVAAIGDLVVFGKGLVSVPSGVRYVRANLKTMTGTGVRIVANLQAQT